MMINDGAIFYAAQDRLALDLILKKRKDKVRTYFDELAGKKTEAAAAGPTSEMARL